MRPLFLLHIGIAVALACGPAMPAMAGIYSFIDENGTIHFSNAPKDPRFNDKNQVTYLRKYRKQQDIREFDYYIRQAASRYEIDPHLIRAVVATESNYDSYAVSRRGARGLMQLMPATAGDMAVNNSFNARQNIEGGCRYLRRLLNMFDENLHLALAAYNAGPGTVKKYQSIPPYRETQEYVRSVLSKFQLYKSKRIYRDQ